MVLYLIASQRLTAKEKWLRISSSGTSHTSAASVASTSADWKPVPDFEVLTDAGESAGRRALERILDLRSALAPRGDCPLPVRVILLGNEAEFAGYRTDSYVKGFYQSGPDIDTIVMFAQGAQTNQILAHEFVHLVRNHQGHRLGRWLEEGFAEYYSTIEFRRGFALAGQEIEAHKWLLRNPDSGSEPLAYARGWAAARALIQLFHGSLRVRMELWPEDGPRAQAAVAELSEVEAMVFRAGLFLQVGKRPEAARLFERIAAAHPNSADAEFGLFQLAMFDSGRETAAASEHNRENARKHILRAIELGAGSEATFEYAMLLRESNAPRADVDRWLDRTLVLSPRHAEAHLIRGVQATAEDQLDSALSHLRAAVSVLPRQSTVWHALAYVEFKAGHLNAAREAAKLALENAKDTQDRAMAESLSALIETPKATPRHGPEVITPDSWKPRLEGERRVEGKLVRVECGTDGAILEVETSEGLLKLTATAETRVARFTNSAAESSAGVEIPCHMASPHRVRVEIRGLAAALTLTAIEFIDD